LIGAAAAGGELDSGEGIDTGEGGGRRDWAALVFVAAATVAEVCCDAADAAEVAAATGLVATGDTDEKADASAASIGFCPCCCSMLLEGTLCDLTVEATAGVAAVDEEGAEEGEEGEEGTKDDGAASLEGRRFAAATERAEEGEAAGAGAGAAVVLAAAGSGTRDTDFLAGAFTPL